MNIAVRRSMFAVVFLATSAFGITPEQEQTQRQLRQAVLDNNVAVIWDYVRCNPANPNPAIEVKYMRFGGSYGYRETMHNSILHVAAQVGRDDMVDLLLKHGAHPDCRNAKEETPLHKAAKHGHCDIVAKLVNAGANSYALDIKGNTPIMSAFYCANDFAIARAKNINPNATWKAIAILASFPIEHMYRNAVTPGTRSGLRSIIDATIRHLRELYWRV